MIIKKILISLAILFGTASYVGAQSVFEQILSGFVQGAAQGLEIATIRKVLNNPSMQSADLKKYLENYRNGNAYMEARDYYNALESYSAAWVVGFQTRDPILAKLWSEHGWAQDTQAKINQAKLSVNIARQEGLINLRSSMSSGSSNAGTSSSYGSSSSSSNGSNATRIAEWEARLSNAQRQLADYQQQLLSNPNSALLKHNIRTTEEVIRTCNQRLMELRSGY